MPVTTYVYPTAQKLEAIEQDLLPQLTPDDPIFGLFPLEEDLDDVLRWEQLDVYKGLQQIRGVNGDPPKIARVGIKGYLMEPGVYGERASVDERELQKRRKLGTFGDRVDITDLVRQIQENLITREFARIRQVLWTLLTTGTFSVSTKDGVLVQTDTFPLQTYTAGVSWATAATSTPLADLRAAKLLGRGHSVNFGRKAVAFMNQVTANNMLANTNQADLGRVRTQYGATLNSLNGDNGILLDNDLPQIVIMDDTYYDDYNNLQLYVPNNKVVIVGVRPNGRSVGSYRKTFNANNGTGGSYMLLTDNKGEDVPREVVVHRGHNGGPVIYFPSAVIIMNT